MPTGLYLADLLQQSRHSQLQKFLWLQNYYSIYKCRIKGFIYLMNKVK